MAARSDHLIWIDLEMTGLDTQSDWILEVATIVTDKDLNVLAEGPVLAVHQSDEVLAAMDDWNRTTHGKSGLIDRVRKSPLDEVAVEQATIAFLKEWIGPRQSPMCGNSICQDRRFLARCMPDLEAYFHYRNLDVSTIKELAKRWSPGLLGGLKKDASHQALQDIRDSIAELSWYREKFFDLPVKNSAS
ncbi:MAG: oligoribonuclease [Thioalkalivibrionaceae bacterium]